MSARKKPFDFFGNMIAKAKNKSKDFVDAQDAKDSEFVDKTATLRPMLKSQFLGLVFLGGFSLIGAKLAYVTLFRPFDEARSSARAETQRITAVSYTHLDVYKRQFLMSAPKFPKVHALHQY